MHKKQEKRIRAVIFDFDGTLAELNIDFDLMRKRLNALAEIFLGRRPEPTTRPVLEWLDDLSRQVGTRDRVQGLELHSRGRLVITAMELDAARRGRLFDFSREILDKLRQQGVATAIITRNCTPAVKSVFPDLEEYCPVLLARDDVPNPKPHPDHVQRALNALGSEAGETLVVGDHPMDIQGAKAAGTLSAAVASGRTALQDLADCEPDVLARDCEDLMRELENCSLLETGRNI